MKEKILIAEDETRIAQWIKTYAEREGYNCTMVHNGRDAVEMVRKEQPDLLLLDIMLPGIDGWRVCEILREESDIPIIMLTARITEQDIIHGLKLGADDYVTKPFSPAELMARIEANLRRVNNRHPSEQRISAGPFILEMDTRQCLLNGDPISLTANQFNLLTFFMQHPRQVLTREQLIDNVFGLDYDSYERAIDIHIRRLRTRIESDPSKPRYLQTVFGTGYRFCPDGV
jgi:DNA-binding response OmpR family regulator